MLAKKYPFLLPLGRIAGIVVGGYGEASLDLLAGDEDLVRLGFRRAVAAVEGWLGYPFGSSLEEELASFALSLSIAARAGPRALRKVVEGEASRAVVLLKREPPDVIAEVLAAAGFPVERRLLEVPWVEDRGRIVRLSLGWRMGVSSFLKLSAYSGSAELRMPNQMVMDGFVYMGDSRLREAAVAAARMAVEARAGEAAILESMLIEDYSSMLGVMVEGGAPIVVEALPPCISRIVSKASRGEALTWGEMYLLLSFMASIRAPPQAIEEILRPSLGESARGVAWAYSRLEPTRYQVPSCEALGRMGICECRGSLVKDYVSRVRRALGLPPGKG
ncbi:MAG: hypothetical protein F7B20_08130 [Aeropyrum sp.]|nr:hypothetical protein [Aeropyrum sp.]MCE4616416.1 hypothetical protein [Aeropyrum sp.]